MWTGIIVLIVVAVLTAGSWWFLGPAPKNRGQSRGGGGVQPGRDYIV